MNKRWTYIDSETARDAAIAQMQGAHWLAVDTEFQREKTYRAQLCLVQVGNGEHDWLFDALSLDLTPLWALLADAKITKVMHSADQDNEVFVQLFGACFEPLFDTQIAASLLGIGDQLGYAGLVKARLGLEIDKRMSRTDWTRRPLPEAALDYAAADVQHLARIYTQLRGELENIGRLAWLQEDAARLCETQRYLCDPPNAWTRIKGLGRLKPREQQIAAGLASWRETEAASKDRPRRWILSDTAILTLAQRRPQSQEELQQLQLEGVNERLAEVLYQQVLPAAYSAATDVALVVAQRMDDERKRQFKLLSGKIRDRAEQLNIPSAMLAPRAEIEALLDHGADAPVRLLQGWRREQCGERLLGLLRKAAPAPTAASVWGQ